MKAFRFLTRQLLALIIAVISGLLAGQLLSTLPVFLFNQLGSSFMNQYQTLIRGAFWLIPFVISLCISLLISLGVRKNRVGEVAA